MRRTGSILAKDRVSKRPRLPTASQRTHSPNASSLKSEKSRKWIGAHVSAAGGLYQAVLNAREIDADAFALFLRPRQWNAKPLDPSSVDQFRQVAAEHGFDYRHILPHGQYIVNLGKKPKKRCLRLFLLKHKANPNEEKRRKALDYFVQDLKCCDQLGIRLFNFQ